MSSVCVPIVSVSMCIISCILKYLLVNISIGADVWNISEWQTNSLWVCQNAEAPKGQISPIQTVQTRVLTLIHTNPDSQTQKPSPFLEWLLIWLCIKIHLKKWLIPIIVTIIITYWPLLTFSRSPGLNGPARSHLWLAQDHPHVRAGQVMISSNSRVWTANMGILYNCITRTDYGLVAEPPRRNMNVMWEKSGKIWKKMTS